MELQLFSDKNFSNISFDVRYSAERPYQMMSLGHNHFVIQDNKLFKTLLETHKIDAEFVKYSAEEYYGNKISTFDALDYTTIFESVGQSYDIAANIDHCNFIEIVLRYKIASVVSKTLHLHDDVCYNNDIIPGKIVLLGGKINSTYNLITFSYGMSEEIEYKLNGSHHNNLLKVLSIIHSKLNNGGDCVVKFTDTFTNISVDIFELYIEIFKDVFVYKPHTSLHVKTDKYLVCKGYIKSKFTKKINDVLNLKYDIDVDGYITNLIDKDMTVNNKLNNILSEFNGRLVIDLHDGLFNSTNFINLNNKSGEEFNNYQESLRDHTKSWIARFNPDK